MHDRPRLWWLGPAVQGFIAGTLTPAVLWLWSTGALDGLTGADTPFFWYVSRASGITAYLLLTAAMVLGLGVFTRLFDPVAPRASSFALHEHTSWLALGFTGLHAAALLLDRSQPFGLAQVLVPFVAAYRPVPVGLGVLALYGAGLLTASFALKSWLGHRTWRTLHYLSFGIYVLATLHGLLAGSGTGQAWVQWLYLGSSATVFFLALYRTLLPPRSGAPRSGTPARDQARTAS